MYFAQSIEEINDICYHFSVCDDGYVLWITPQLLLEYSTDISRCAIYDIKEIWIRFLSDEFTQSGIPPIHMHGFEYLVLKKVIYLNDGMWLLISFEDTDISFYMSQQCLSRIIHSDSLRKCK